MCNVYRMTSSVEAMRRLFGVAPDSAPNLPVFDEIYPDRDAPVILARADDTRHIALMRWGFPPPVAATRPVTNVRNLASPFWRTALSRPDRRCLVPVTAFADWTAEPDPATRPQAQGVVRRCRCRGVRVRRHLAADRRVRALRLPDDNGERARGERPPQSSGGARTPTLPSKLLTISEAAFRRVAIGRSPGSAWRTRHAGEFRECIEALAAPVCWRAGGGGPGFARYFDEAGNYGRQSFYVSEPHSDGVLAALAVEDVRTRASVVASIGHLLLKPDALRALARVQTLPFDLRADAFSSLVEFLNPAQRDRLVQCSSGLPDCVRQPLRAAIGETYPSDVESQLFRAPDRTISPEMSAVRLHSDGVSSIPLQ